MATDLIIRRVDSRLIPVSQLDFEELERIPRGKDLACRLWQPRSLPRQRFYRGLLALVIKATGRFPTAESLHVWLKVKYGLVEAIDTSGDNPIFVLGSTAFDALNEIEFGKFVDFAILTIMTEIMPGVRQSTITKEVEAMIGPTLRIAA